MAVIAAGLLLVGSGLTVALGIEGDAAPSADSVDAGVARDMSAHHLQGVAMASPAADRSHNPGIRRLAFDIPEPCFLAGLRQAGERMAQLNAGVAQPPRLAGPPRAGPASPPG